MTATPAHRLHRTLTLSWIALVILSVITVVAGDFDQRLLAGLIVLCAGLAKAWLIIDHFMELRQGPRFWRLARRRESAHPAPGHPDRAADQRMTIGCRGGRNWPESSAAIRCLK